HQRLDDRVDAVPPGTPLRRRSSLTCRKARRKKSSSICCSPILRSSSAIRRSDRARLSRSPPPLPPATTPSRSPPAPPAARLAHPSALVGPLQLPSPTAPPTRTRSRHWYRDFGLIPSSAASTLGRSPASNRRSAASLNSRLNLRASFRAISSPFSKENCPSFHCRIPGTHSTSLRLQLNRP